MANSLIASRNPLAFLAKLVSHCQSKKFVPDEKKPRMSAAFSLTNDNYLVDDMNERLFLLLK